MRADLDQRFWSKVYMTSDCWEWRAARTRDGYGHIWLDNHAQRAHRVAYERLVGPIPDGLTLDHLCRNRACVRPEHLEPVSHKANCLRGTSFAASNAQKMHCPKGHLYDDDNVYRRPDGTGRYCRTCQRDRWEQSS